jgi:hypothetical protein
LTLSEQLEAVMRRAGIWTRKSCLRVQAVLTEFSELAARGYPDLFALRALRPIAWERRPDVAWRVALAQEVVVVPETELETEAAAPVLRLALSLQGREDHTSEWPDPVVELLGRYLHCWARRVGPVELSVDDSEFALRFADAVACAKGPEANGHCGPVQSAATTASRRSQRRLLGTRAISAWSWAAWMVWKEARWRPLWLSWRTALLAFVLAAAAPAISTGWFLVLDARAAAHVILAVLAVLALFVRSARADSASTSRWFQSAGKWSDRRSVRPWVVLRGLVGGSETAALSVAGSLFAAAVTSAGILRGIDWAFTRTLATLTGMLVALIMTPARRT